MCCYSAILIFESLTAAELRELCQFMRDNRKLSLDTAVRAMFDVYVVNGEDTIVRREPPLPRLPFPMPIALPDDDEVLPF